MNSHILKNIITSCNIATKTESLDEWECINEDENFPILKDSLIDGLSKVFARLLTYRVSREAYQRYSVRLNVIEILRDWSRIKHDLRNIPVLQENSRCYSVLLSVLKKYLNILLNNCDDVEVLVQMAAIFLHSSKEDESSVRYLSKVLKKMFSFNQTPKSEQLLKHIFYKSVLECKTSHKSNQLILDPTILEELFHSQKSTLIEKPFNDYFQLFLSDVQEISRKQHLKKLDVLLERIIDEPVLFQLMSYQLKNIFVTTNYDQTAQDFIQSILKKINALSKKFEKDSLYLYPQKLRFCVPLLRIEPKYHTESSKQQTIQSLKRIFLDDNNDALMLISHFPKWLQEYKMFFEILNEPSQNSDDYSQSSSVIEIT